jgi:hypothetical protein
MQAAAAGPGTGGSVPQPVRKRAVAASLVQCRSRLRQEVREREAAAGVGAIWSAVDVGAISAAAADVDELWRREKEKERRVSASASGLGVRTCEVSGVIFFLFTLSRFIYGCESRGLVTNGTQCQSAKRYREECQITHRPDQMNEPNHLK